MKPFIQFIPNTTKVDGYNDHVHLGLNYDKVNWKYVQVAPVLNRIQNVNIMNSFIK